MLFSLPSWVSNYEFKQRSTHQDSMMMLFVLLDKVVVVLLQ